MMKISFWYNWTAAFHNREKNNRLNDLNINVVFGKTLR